jgi:hypothetical protein
MVESMNNEAHCSSSCVFDLGFTKAGLLAEGIDIDIRPAGTDMTAFENKFGAEGR